MKLYELESQINSIIHTEDDEIARGQLESCINGIINYCSRHEKDLIFDYEKFYEVIYLSTLISDKELES